MRKQLKAVVEERKTFIGQFVRHGTKPGFEGRLPQPTLLLQKIKDAKSGKIMTDHLWFNYTNGFRALGRLTKGDKIKFDARVKEYIKGYVNYREGTNTRRADYKLSHPTKISKV
jgi:hypothetical protein